LIVREWWQYTYTSCVIAHVSEVVSISQRAQTSAHRASPQEKIWAWVKGLNNKVNNDYFLPFIFGIEFAVAKLKRKLNIEC
jgi:hypothetical protein